MQYTYLEEKKKFTHCKQQDFKKERTVCSYLDVTVVFTQTHTFRRFWQGWITRLF